jgi:gliding motility-associated protein GldM
MTLKGSAEYKDYTTMYASLIPLKEQMKIVKGIGDESKPWADFNFGNVPVIASDVILEKLKNDIINTEAQVLEYLIQQVQGGIIDFDVLEAEVIAPKSYLAAGNKYEAAIFISATSSKTKMDIFIGKVEPTFFEAGKKVFVSDESLPFKGDYKSIPIVNGKAKFEETASGVGAKNYEGIVRVKIPTGGYELYPFKADYEVAPPSGMSVSATMMNVLYIGLENPVSIAVNGAKSDADVKASISQGSLSKKWKWAIYSSGYYSRESHHSCNCKY